MENPNNLTQKPKKPKTIEAKIIQKIVFKSVRENYDDTYLILKRNPETCKVRKNNSDLPGGKFDNQDKSFDPDNLIDHEEFYPLQRSVLREVYEEIDYIIYPENLIQIYLGSDFGKVLTIAIIYLYKLEDEFVPNLSKEHTSYQWVNLEKLGKTNFGADIHINEVIKKLLTVD
jgi:8-oxo-dGTP pyrophosphatase MutT (NUDIX family)